MNPFVVRLHITLHQFLSPAACAPITMRTKCLQNVATQKSEGELYGGILGLLAFGSIARCRGLCFADNEGSFRGKTSFFNTAKRASDLKRCAPHNSWANKKILRVPNFFSQKSSSAKITLPFLLFFVSLLQHHIRLSLPLKRSLLSYSSCTEEPWTPFPRTRRTACQKSRKLIFNDDSRSRADANDKLFDEKATARLLRKQDITLIPFLSLLYL